MKLGIKVGYADWEEKLSLAKYEAVEVHFRPNEVQSYIGLFNHLKRLNIATGLHFWGTIKNDYLPNIAIDSPGIVNQSMSVIKQSIDIVSYWKFNYLLIHTFSCDFWKLKSEILEIKPYKIPWGKSLNLIRKNLKKSQ